MVKMEVIESDTKEYLIKGPVEILPRKGEYINLHGITYAIHRVVYEIIPTTTTNGTMLARIYVDRL